MATLANIDLIRSWVEEVWNDGRLDRARQFVAPTFVAHNVPSLPSVRGIEGHDRWVRESRQRLVGWHVALDQLVAQGDAVAARWTVTGAHPQTRERVAVPGAHFYRVERGKIAELWISFDRYAAGLRDGKAAGPRVVVAPP